MPPEIDVAVIEDDDSVREATERLLHILGCATASFATAEGFLDSGCLGYTACLIVDMHLPGMSGAELQDRLIADACCIPIIFMTAFDDEAARVQALSKGAVCYLSKPLHEEKLIFCLDQALRHFRREQP
jgi:FixJ family two-component response regulator